MTLPDALSLRASIVSGERTAEEVIVETVAVLERPSSRGLGAFLTFEHERALERARGLDRALRGGALPGALFGVPIALKANLALEGAEVNCGSRLLAGWRAPYTATAVQRLLDAGAVPVGATNMDEFGMGSSSENSAFEAARNPWDRARTPGGSSGGSAAAVAAGLVPLALGSDTGGSVRQPAALCGVVGFKPSYGRVSRHGLVAFGSSLDQIGPLAARVRDAEVAFEVMAGADERDSSCLRLPAPETGRRWRLSGMRIGVPAEYLSLEIDPGVRACFEAALARLVELGAERVDVSLPHTRYAIPTYYVVATAEASSNLARFDGVRYGRRESGDGTAAGMLAATRGAGFGIEVQRRILLGTFALSAGWVDEWYGRAGKVRRRIAEEFERVFEGVDLLVTPTSPLLAFPLGARVDDPLAMYRCDVMTAPASLAGLPAVSVPCGFAPDGDAHLPVGLQIIGRALDDARVLGVARAFEEATEHWRGAPPGEEPA